MSLLTYSAAMPWAESIREQLTSEAMPPWFADPTGPGVKGGHHLPAREMDMLLTWATGGAPEGDSAQVPAPAGPRPEWSGGKPDLVVETGVATLGVGVIEDAKEFVVPTALTSERWVRAVDVEPGTPSMVRAVTVSLEGEAGVLCAWVPGHDTAETPSGSAFRVPASARLLVRIQYHKHWEDEREVRSDRSRIGLYFTEEPVSGRGIDAMTTEAGSLPGAIRVLAVRPRVSQAYDSIAADAVLPDARRIPLLRLHRPRPSWDRRYWLAESLDLPVGTRLEVTTTPSTDDSVGAEPATGATAPIVELDYVAL